MLCRHLSIGFARQAAEIRYLTLCNNQSKIPNRKKKSSLVLRRMCKVCSLSSPLVVSCPHPFWKNLDFPKGVWARDYPPSTNKKLPTPHPFSVRSCCVFFFSKHPAYLLAASGGSLHPCQFAAGKWQLKQRTVSSKCLSGDMASFT